MRYRDTDDDGPRWGGGAIGSTGVLCPTRGALVVGPRSSATRGPHSSREFGRARGFSTPRVGDTVRGTRRTDAAGGAPASGGSTTADGGGRANVHRSQPRGVHRIDGGSTGDGVAVDDRDGVGQRSTARAGNVGAMMAKTDTPTQTPAARLLRPSVAEVVAREVARYERQQAQRRAQREVQ